MRKQIASDEVYQLATDLLVAWGASVDDAKYQVQSLIEADLRGLPSHGVMRLPRIIERIRNGVLSPTSSGQHNWLGRSLLSVDGQMGLGPVVVRNALKAAMPVVEEQGCCLIAIRNNNHIGMLAGYVEEMAQKGFVALGFSTSEALVHPWGGSKALIGTNPVAVGVPTPTEPFVLDMATSLVSMGKIHDYAARGATLPEGWALDGAGVPTTDAEAAKAGAVAPFGGAKGYGLGLAIELLVTTLCDSAIGTDIAGTLDESQICNKGDVFLLSRTATNGIGETINRYLDEVRQSPPLESGEAVSVPGDRMRQRRAVNHNQGLTLPDSVMGRLNSLFAERGLKPILGETNE